MIVKVIWCLLFHRRYRHRTGDRRIHRVSISYDVRCEKCGTEDVEIKPRIFPPHDSIKE